MKGFEKELALRFYAVESAFSLTGSNADHRLRLQSGKIGEFLFQLANSLADIANPALKKIFEGFYTIIQHRPNPKHGVQKHRAKRE